MFKPAITLNWYAVSDNPPCEAGEQRDIIFGSSSWGWPIKGMVTGYGTREAWIERLGNDDHYPGKALMWSVYDQENDRYQEWTGDDPELWMSCPRLPNYTEDELNRARHLCLEMMVGPADIDFITQSTAFSEFVAMGEKVIELIIQCFAVQAYNEFFFVALEMITGVKPEGDLEPHEKGAKWVRWFEFCDYGWMQKGFVSTSSSRSE